MYIANNLGEGILHNKSAGYHFFDSKSMAFFGSRLETKLLENNTFVTSEELYGIIPRKFTVRVFDSKTARILDGSKFMEYEDLDAALDAAHKYNNI